MANLRAFYQKAVTKYTLWPIAFMLMLLVSNVNTHAALPSLGAGYSTTEAQEEALGQAWLSLLRGQGNLLTDPVVVSYLEDLTQSLAAVSELDKTKIHLLTIDDASFNGFAVPGRVMGLNSGLLLAAQSEGELASVIAHELAHLSQRHYAEQVAQQKQNTPYLIAAMLGSLLLASQSPDAGVAALTSTIASSAQASVTFTRENEKEADAIGIKTLEAAGYAGKDMARMFGRLATQSRFQSEGLAFLRTHPLTNDRIAAANARARASASSTNRLSNDYGFEVAKARMVSKYTSSPSALITSLRAPLQNENATALDAYRLIYTLMDHDQLAAARSLFDKTAAQLNNTLYGILLNGELALKEQNYTLAHEAAESILDLIPSHYSAMRLAAESLEKLERYDQSAAILQELSKQRPKDAYVWYQLAEVHGLANNTAELHLSRIHYFIVTGQPERALKQIQFAKQSGTVSEHRLSLLKRDAEQLKQQITEALG